MKIREGFVSNSSSASYIIKIHNITKENFCTGLRCVYGWDFLNKEHFIGELKKDIDNLSKYIGSDSTLEQYWAKKVPEIQELLKKSQNENISDVDLVTAVLEHNHVQITEDADSVIIDTSTTMHNSFVEGINDITKEIIFHSMANGYKVELAIEEDS